MSTRTLITNSVNLKKLTTNPVGDVFLQALRRQLARRPGGEPQVQRGRGQGRIEGRLSALVQRSQVPTAEHRQAA